MRVTDARTEIEEDPFGDPALVIVLVLADPPDDAETWPVDDLWALRRIVRDVVDEVGTPSDVMSWFVSFESAEPSNVGSADAPGQIGHDAR